MTTEIGLLSVFLVFDINPPHETRTFYGMEASGAPSASPDIESGKTLIEFSTYAGYCVQVDPEALKLAEEIEASRQEIAKLQERVKQLVARRGKRAELVKSAHILATPELSTEPANGVRVSSSIEDEDVGKELTIEEGLTALKSVPMSAVRLIAFKHGAIVFLFADEKTMTIRMDQRGPKPLLDLLTANDQHHAKTPAASTSDKRIRA